MTTPRIPPSASPGSGVSSGLAAIGLVVVVTLVWWLLSGNGPQGPRGNDDVYAVPSSEPSNEPSNEPGSRGTAGGGAGTRGGAGSEPALANPNGVRIDGFLEPTPSRLVLRYTAGVPECYGRLDTPEVLETDASVTITLTLVPPHRPPDQCPDLAVLGTVDVDLDTALGDRSVLDGSFAQRVRVSPAGEG